MVRPKKYPLFGFSLIELVIVILIVSVMAIMAIPRFANLSTYRSRVFYDDVINTLRYARKLAVGKNLHIQADITANSISLRQRTEGSNCSTASFNTIINPKNNSSPYIETAPNNVTLSPAIALYFDGLGKAYLVSGSTSARPLINNLTVTLSGALTATITIAGETGFVQGSL